MLTKELVTVEFRYYDEPDNIQSVCRIKTVTIGVFNTFDEAIIEANKILEIFESKFPLNPNYKIKQRFNKTGGCFNSPIRLITNLGYLITPFEFYFKIKQLKYSEITTVISEVLNSVKQYKIWKELQTEES